MDSLLSEFKRIISTLNEHQVSYALCGGLALAVHGIPRATVDIDLLVPESELSGLRKAIKSLGYEIETPLDILMGSKLKISRFTRFPGEIEEYFILDILHAENELAVFFEQREQIATPDGLLWILPAETLIKMKSLRNSSQDIWDIAQLTKRLTDEG